MKTIRLIHKWIGLAIGLFLFISCTTGIVILAGKLSGSYAPVFRWMKTLHRTLFIGDAGSTIMGTAALMLIVEIVTGYCLWWRAASGLAKTSISRGEGRLAGLCRSVSWTFPTLRRGSHVAAGVWSGLALMLMALTGLTWSFGWYSDIVYRLFDPAGSGNLFHSISSLHTGNFLGLISRLVWLVMAVLGASLPVTGLILACRH